jgi:hypothetical protein
VVHASFISRRLLAWVAVAALAKAAEQMRDEGSFALLDVSPPIGEWLG